MRLYSLDSSDRAEVGNKDCGQGLLTFPGSPWPFFQLRGEIQTISSLQGLLAKENGMSCLVEARLERED